MPNNLHSTRLCSVYSEAHSKLKNYESLLSILISIGLFEKHTLTGYLQEKYHYDVGIRAVHHDPKTCEHLIRQHWACLRTDPTIDLSPLNKEYRSYTPTELTVACNGHAQIANFYWISGAQAIKEARNAYYSALRFLYGHRGALLAGINQGLLTPLDYCHLLKEIQNTLGLMASLEPAKVASMEEYDRFVTAIAPNQRPPTTIKTPKGPGFFTPLYGQKQKGIMFTALYTSVISRPAYKDYREMIDNTYQQACTGIKGFIAIERYSAFLTGKILGFNKMSRFDAESLLETLKVHRRDLEDKIDFFNVSEKTQEAFLAKLIEMAKRVIHHETPKANQYRSILK
jgi:hypothetical protein